MATTPDTTRPLCKCHGEPMHQRNDRWPGWRCAIQARENNRRWREAHPDKQREKNLRWRDANRKRIAELGRQWRAANPEKKRESNAQRIRVGDIYLGTCGFTRREREELLSGPAK